MSYEGYIAIASVIISLLVAYGGLRKGKADTYTSYQEALAHAQKNYDELSARFDKLEVKYHNMELWNRALIQQLMDAKILPISLEKAIKRNETNGYS